MRVAELEKMYQLEDTYWWFVARRDLVRRLLLRYLPKEGSRRIADVGCGTGATLALLRPFGLAPGLKTGLLDAGSFAHAHSGFLRRMYNDLNQSKASSRDFSQEAGRR